MNLTENFYLWKTFETLACEKTYETKYLWNNSHEIHMYQQYELFS